MASAESADIVDALFRRYTLVGATVGIAVLGYLLVAAWWHRSHGRREPKDAPRAGETSPDRGQAWIIWSMVAAIALILFPLAIGTQSSHDHLETPHEEPGLVLDVTGFRYGWTIRYPGGFEGLNEVRIPAGVLVRLDVTSMDVMHKFHVADYRTGVDAMPGKTNHLHIMVPEPGSLSVVHCAELCGPGHALMKATIVVMAPEDFQSWLAAQQAPADGAPAQVVHANMTDDGVVLDVDRLMGQVPVELRIHNQATTPRAIQVNGLWQNTSQVLQPNGQATIALDPAISGGTMTLQAQDEAGAAVGPANDVAVRLPIKAAAILSEFKVAFDTKRFPAGSPVLLTVTNAGAIPHDLHLGSAANEQGATPVLSGSSSVFLPFWMPESGPIDAWCALPGHADGGMRETLEATP